MDKIIRPDILGTDSGQERQLRVERVLSQSYVIEKIIGFRQKTLAEQDGEILLDDMIFLNGNSTQRQVSKLPLDSPIISVGEKGHALYARQVNTH